MYGVDGAGHVHQFGAFMNEDIFPELSKIWPVVYIHHVQ